MKIESNTIYPQQSAPLRLFAPAAPARARATRKQASRSASALVVPMGPGTPSGMRPAPVIDQPVGKGVSLRAGPGVDAPAEQLGWRLGVPMFFSLSTLDGLRLALRRQPLTLLIEGYPVDPGLKQELERGFSTRPHSRGIVVRTTPGSASRLTDTIRKHLHAMGGHWGTLYPYGHIPSGAR